MSVDRVQLTVSRHVDGAIARSLALRFARERGADDLAATEIAIVAGELASNLVRHAGTGLLELEVVVGSVVVRSVDRASSGPIPAPLRLFAGDVPRAVEMDGSMRAGLGCGLGAIRRLSDEVHVKRRPDGALEIVAARRIA